MANLFLTKMPKQFIGEEEMIFNRWSWDKWLATLKKMEVERYLPQSTKTNSQ